jgi:hypothetical protein
MTHPRRPRADDHLALMPKSERVYGAARGRLADLPARRWSSPSRTRCQRTTSVSSRLTAGGGEDRGREFVGLTERDQVPTRTDDGFDAKSRAGQLLLKLDGKTRSSRPAMTVTAAGQAVNVHGSRYGRCDWSPFGVAVASTCGGTSWNR